MITSSFADDLFRSDRKPSDDHLEFGWQSFPIQIKKPGDNHLEFLLTNIPVQIEKTSDDR